MIKSGKLPVEAGGRCHTGLNVTVRIGLTGLASALVFAGRTWA
jgi:hypothetical protein